MAAIAELEAVAFATGGERPWAASAIEGSVVSAAEGSRDRAWVAVDERAIALGWIAFRQVLDEAELLRIAVDPRRRQQGIGRRLAVRGLSSIRDAGAQACYLEVRDGNHAALALYRGLGFEPVGRRRAYYPGGIDALLLCAEW